MDVRLIHRLAVYSVTEEEFKMPSRSPFAFQRRKRLRSLNWPASTFAPGDLLVHKYPSEKTLGKLAAAEGDPPPLRAKIVDWTPPTSEE